MTRDPSLANFKDSRDVVRHDWSIERVGEEILRQIVLSQLLFTINRPAADLWKYMKDFNLWHEDLQYNNVVGDQAEGQTYVISIREKYYEHYRRIYGFDPASARKVLIVRKAVSGKLLVLEGLSEDRRAIDSYYLWALNGDHSRTTVTGFMSHAPLWAPGASEDRIRQGCEAMVNDVEERWREFYIPRLRQLAEGR